MKNVLIVGASRSGKSTVAKRIAKAYSMTYVPIDAIVSTIENLYPEVGLKHVDDNAEMSKKVAVFLKQYLAHLDYEGINYVVDLYQLYPDDLSKICDLDRQLILYFGYPKATAEEKLIHIKTYARAEDWTTSVSDNEMLEIVGLFIRENNLMYQQCKQHGFKFFDTGNEFELTLLEAEEYISENIT